MLVDFGGGHRLKIAYIENAWTPDALAQMATYAWIVRGWNGAPGAIRTPDLLVRSQIESDLVNHVFQ